jgi:hypothetical protein
MTSPTKNVYIVSIINSTGTMVQYCIVSAGMTAAIAQAQTAAGVTSDPVTAQKLAGPINYEV